MKKIEIGKLLKYVILIIIAIIQLFPLYWLITFSLKSNVEIFGENVIGLPQNWRFENYIEAFTKSEIVRYFLNSVFYSAATVVIAGLLTAMAAYAIARMQWKGREAAFGFFQ